MPHTQDLHYRPLHLQEFPDEERTARLTKRGEFVSGYGVPEPEKAEPAPPPEPEVPSFSEEELAAAQKEAEAIGYQKGLIAGKAEAKATNAEREEALTAAVNGLMERLNEELAAHRAEAEMKATKLTALVTAVARKMSGKALDSQPLSAIEPMLAECLTMLSGERHIHVFVTPDHVDLLRDQMKKNAVTVKSDISIEGDERLQIGDCRVQWAGGEAERNQESLWQEVEQIIARAIEKNTAPSHK